MSSSIMCANCGICVNRLARHIVLKQSISVVSFIAERISPRIITENDNMCRACLDVITKRVNKITHGEIITNGKQIPERSHTQVVGHSKVCLLCGRSIFRRKAEQILHSNPSELQEMIATIIMNFIGAQELTAGDKVCLPCWLRSKRTALRMQNMDERSKYMADRARRIELANTRMPKSQVKKRSATKELDFLVKNEQQINEMKAQQQEESAGERRYGLRDRIGDLETVHLLIHESQIPEPSHADKEHSRDPSPIEKKSRVFCPKCNTEVSHTAEVIQQDQTKILIAKVYHYLEEEYEELKKLYGSLDLTPLSKLHQRTALATGVSETTVLQILKEEEERNAAQQEEPPQTERRTRKRPRPSYYTQEDSSDDNSDYDEQSSEEPEIIIQSIKLEPTEDEVNEQQSDPIWVDMKTEPQDDESESTNETLALDKPGTSNLKARKKQRKTDETTQQHSQDDDASTMETSTTISLKEELDDSYETLALDEPCTTNRKGREKQKETDVRTQSGLIIGIDLKLELNEEGFS